MKIPSVISRSVLQTLAAPGETHAVRVILHEVNNPGQFRLRTTRRQYIFERDGNLGVHALTIPASCWMEGTLPGRFRDNPSISQDFRTAGDVKWSIQIVPWGTATAAAPDNSKECLALLRKLLSNIGAPEEVESAFQFIESGNMASLRKLVALLTEESPPEPVPQLTPGQLRAQKMREAKAAKKAQLQPA